MLDLGFRDELEAILAQVPKQRATHLVSATFPAAVRNLTKRYQQNALHIEGTALGSAHADIEHIAHLLNARDRYGALVNHLLLAGDARVLVFVRTREDTASLADKLETDGFRAMPISGDLTQGQRTRTLAAFRRGTITTLVATDVAARGLDIENVQAVVHMDPPIDSESYTHRSGRTGRAGQKGTSVLMVPRTMERRAARLLAEARVQAQWRPVPNAAQVQAARDERLVAKLAQGLAAGEPGAASLAIAKRLLADHEPAKVVAALLLQAGGGPVCEPFDFGTPAVRSAPARERPGPAPRSHADKAPAPVAPAAALPTAPRSEPARPATPEEPERPLPREAEPGFVLFRINWGTANGADARRILAHLCRRGDIHSKMVGAIDLRQFESTFGIDSSVAGAFAQRVARRDSRDPNLVIHRVGAGGPSRPPKRPARTPQIWSRRTREQGAP
jgi:ATP-dependent RNA helicase DeaD